MSTLKDTQTTRKNQIVDSAWVPFPEIDWVKGGISTLTDGSMAWGRADDHEIVANRIRFLLGNSCDPGRAVAIDQVHGTNIIRVSKTDADHGIRTPDTRIPAADGMITNTPNLVLVTSHGDCAPVYLLDEKNKAIALFHAGWRGIWDGICGKAVQKMQTEFQTDPDNLHAAVGPMISTAHYEVDDKLAAQFIDRFGTQTVNRIDFRLHLDLFSCIVVDLLENGLISDRIPHRPPCTYDNSNYSSFRRDGEGMIGMIAYFSILDK